MSAAGQYAWSAGGRCPAAGDKIRNAPWHALDLAHLRPRSRRWLFDESFKVEMAAVQYHAFPKATRCIFHVRNAMQTLWDVLS